MRLGVVLVITLTLAATIEAKPHYYHEGTISSVEQNHAGQSYVIDSPLGIFNASTQNSFRRKPHFKPGPVRVSIEPSAVAGDSLYLLDENDKEYRAVVLDRKSHPPPSIGF
jgi:hypothetical protein